MSSAVPAIIAISSHVMRGSVGNRAVVFALETLGFRVWSVPTVILPWHPGHGAATRTVIPSDSFSAMLHDLETSPFLGEVRAIISGYLGEAAQAPAIASLVRAARRANPSLLYLCDPVIGDVGGLYVPQATAMAIRDQLVPLADIATPNRYELAWLAEASLETREQMASAALRLGLPLTMVTSAPGCAEGDIGNLLVTPADTFLAEHRMIANAPNGLGDLTAALLLAQRLGGSTISEALGTVTAIVYDILSRTTERHADELTLEAETLLQAPPKGKIRLANPRKLRDTVPSGNRL